MWVGVGGGSRRSVKRNAGRLGGAGAWPGFTCTSACSERQQMQRAAQRAEFRKRMAKGKHEGEGICGTRVLGRVASQSLRYETSQISEDI